MKYFIFQPVFSNWLWWWWWYLRILGTGRNFYVIFKVIAVFFSQNQSFTFLWQNSSKEEHVCPVEVRKAVKKEKLDIWRSVITEENDLSIREVRGFEN